jgi:hypothetical protein
MTRLREMLNQAIQSGDVTTAAAAVESLGRLGDAAYLPVMLDMVEEFEDVPLLQYAAACAALELDEEAGARAMLNVCAVERDEVRELAAFRISRLPRPPVQQLADGLREGGDPLRGSAALGLALSGVCEVSPGQPLVPWLRSRLDPADPQFEASWRVRANYLGSCLVCGDGAARAELDLYLLNEHVSRVGLYVALLASGDTSALDLLLSEPATVDAASLNRVMRFAEVLGHYFPEAPSMLWLEDEEMCQWQTERLRDWWRIHRFRVRFDAGRRVFVAAETDR